MVGEAVQQSPGQAFRAEYLRPLIERQVGGHQDRAPLVALAEDFEQQIGAGLRERDEAEFVDDQMDPSRKSGGALHRLHCFCLEFDGACEVQRRVPTDWIIEPVDVSGYGSFSLAS